MQLLPSTEPAGWSLSDISTLLQNAINLALLLAGGIAIIYLIIGAFGYFTAFGNEEKATKAKQTITWAIAGVVLIILSKVIISEIWNIVSPTPIVLPK